MTAKKQSNAISFGFIAAAAIILANPMPMLLDIFPDVIAYALIILALRRVSAVIPEFDEVKEDISRLALISAFKIPAFFIMMLIWGGNASQRSIVAVFCLVFAIVECCYILPSFHHFFRAFHRLGELHGCNAAVSEGEGSLRMRPERIERLTVIFFIVRSVMSCLPEMTLVPLSESGSGSAVNNLYPVCAILGAIAVLALGIVWCCYFIAYLMRIRADKGTTERLMNACAQNPALPSVSRVRRIRGLVIFYIIGVVCSFDLIFDKVNYLPDFAAAIAFFAAGLVLFYLLRKGGEVLIATGLYGAVSLAYWILSLKFRNAYDYSAIEYNAAARNAYHTLLYVSLAKELLLIAVCILMLRLLLRLIAEETGGTRLEDWQKSARLTRRSLSQKIITCTVFGCLTAIASFFYDLSFIATKHLPADPTHTSGYISVPMLDWLLIVVWACNILWLFFAIWFCSSLREEVQLNAKE